MKKKVILPFILFKNRHWKAIFLGLLMAIGTVSHAADEPQIVEGEVAEHDNSRFLFSDVTTTPTTQGQLSADVKLEPHVKRSRIVSLNVDQLRPQSGIGLRQQMFLNLFDDEIIKASKDKVTRNASGSLTWLGHIDGVARSSVIMIVRDDTLVAKVSFPDAIYEVSQSSSGDQVIKQIKQSTLIDHATEPPEIFAAPEFTGLPQIAADIAADDGSTLDVLVVYSPEARVAAGSVAAIEAIIELSVAESNVAYASSNVSQGLNLVHMYESPEAQQAGFSNNLNNLRSTSDGYLDGVHALRDEYHADFVQLIIEDASSCGLAYVQASPGASFQYSAFGVTAKDCAVGNLSFAHELGHNMGLHHDWYINNSTAPQSWAHGFTNPSDGWRTVMAYNSHCVDEAGANCTRLTYFSNPSNTLGGDPMGVAGGTASNCVPGSFSPINPNSCDADNHAILNSHAAVNSQFRQSEVTWQGYNTNWNDPNNWRINQGPYFSLTPVSRVPRSIDEVLIPTTPVGGNFPSINSGSFSVRNMLIKSGASLNMTGGSLQVYGDWEEQPLGQFNATGGTLSFVGNLYQTISLNASSTFNDLVIGDGVSSQDVTLLSDINVNGDIDILSGSVLLAGANTLVVAGDWNDQAGGFSAQTSLVTLDGDTQNINKQTIQELLNEPFDNAIGVGCCSTGIFPSGWSREQAAGSGFAAGDISFWGGKGGAAVRWNNSADAWLHTNGISLLAEANYEIEYKYRTLFSSTSTSNDFSVSVGTAQSSASMGSAYGLATNAVNSGYLTQIDNFTVPSDGTYYMGFRSQQNVGTGYAVIDDIVLRQITQLPPIVFYDLQINSTQGVTFNQDLEVENNLTINSGDTLDLNGKTLSIEGTLINNGALKQTLDVPFGGSTEFLRIQNKAGSNDLNYGLVITPNSVAMGPTTVVITNGGVADGVGRTYEITPTSSQTALTRFYYRDIDKNGHINPKVYHWNGTSWDDLGASAQGGSGDANYVEATTTAYSPFILADGVPTRATIGDVSLQHVILTDALNTLMPQGADLSLLRALLASFNPQLEGSLANMDSQQLLDALSNFLDPDGDGRVVMLAWETLEERGTVGFYVERQTSDLQWIRLNSDLLPGLLNAPLGAEYLIFDPEVNQAADYIYRLIELEARGSKLQHGPWTLQLKH